MSVNTRHTVRTDLLEVYERLERYTSLRARMMIQVENDMASVITITTSDSHTVNPLIKLAMARLADDLGQLESFTLDGLDALTDGGLVDAKTRLVKGDKSSAIFAVYNLPGSGQSEYVPAVHEFVYEALVADVLSKWFKHIGLHDIAMMYAQDYNTNLQQARNATPRFKHAPKRRPSVNL